jgi:hypothetical protein
MYTILLDVTVGIHHMLVKPPMVMLPLDVWRVVARFCGPCLTYVQLRAVCNQLHMAFSCWSKLLPHSMRSETWDALLHDLPHPPKDVGLFAFHLSHRVPAPVTDLVMNFCLRRLYSVARLELDLGEWARAESLVALQHIGSIPRLHQLIVRLSGNQHLSRPLLTGMVQHWSQIGTLSQLSFEAHNCNLGPGMVGRWQSGPTARWCLATIRLDFSMNRLGCSDAQALGHFIKTLGRLQLCEVNLELNNVRASGANALRAACDHQSHTVVLQMWLNPH